MSGREKQVVGQFFEVMLSWPLEAQLKLEEVSVQCVYLKAEAAVSLCG